MKTVIIRVLALAAIVVCAAGCASTRTYFASRARDAADIVTLTGGIGAGAKARVGPLTVGLFGNVDWVGLRMGTTFINQPSRGPEYVFGMADMNCTVSGREQCGRGWPGVVRARGKAFTARTVAAVSVEQSSGETPTRQRIPYYTQVEATLGLGPTLRVGVNPGELVDFIFGWAGLDLFDDDVQRPPEEKESNQPSERTR